MPNGRRLQGVVEVRGYCVRYLICELLLCANIVCVCVSVNVCVSVCVFVCVSVYVCVCV